MFLDLVRLEQNCMARKSRKKTQRRRRKSGISVLGVAETVALSNVATQTLFNVNAWDFIQGGNNFGAANAITLRELMNPTQRSTMRGPGGQTLSYATNTMDLVQQNLQSNWIMGATQMVTIPLAFRIGKQLARPAISRVNALLRKAGVASTIRV
jgi:hypothetical protein